MSWHLPVPVVVVVAAAVGAVSLLLVAVAVVVATSFVGVAAVKASGEEELTAEELAV